MTLKLYSDEEIEEIMQIISEEYDDKMAEIFYIQCMKDRTVHKRKLTHLIPNLQRCLDCQYSIVVTDENLNPIKIDCSRGYTLLDMSEDYCIEIID